MPIRLLVAARAVGINGDGKLLQAGIKLFASEERFCARGFRERVLAHERDGSGYERESRNSEARVQRQQNIMRIGRPFKYSFEFSDSRQRNSVDAQSVRYCIKSFDML